MKLTEDDLAAYRKQFESLIETLEENEGKTILGFACVLITAEDSAGIIYGGNPTFIQSGIDYLSSTYLSNVTLPDEVQDRIEEAFSSVN